MAMSNNYTAGEHLDWMRGLLDEKDREIDRLMSLLARVHDELHDPIGHRWGDHPVSDGELIEKLRDYVTKEMGWEETNG